MRTIALFIMSRSSMERSSDLSSVLLQNIAYKCYLKNNHSCMIRRLIYSPGYIWVPSESRGESIWHATRKTRRTPQLPQRLLKSSTRQHLNHPKRRSSDALRFRTHRCGGGGNLSQQLLLYWRRNRPATLLSFFLFSYLGSCYRYDKLSGHIFSCPRSPGYDFQIVCI